MMARQGNVSLQDVLDQNFMDENSQCETDVCDAGWQPSSDENEESDSEIVTVATTLQC